jgi:3-phenylpropionate/trans-cinnamate dioxygenase ferredoxin reductase subunit
MHAGPTDRIVILGAGHAGGRAAEALRTAGFPGKVTLLGEEPYPPYERPPLSKELLAGAIPVEKTFVKPQSWYAEKEIALRLGMRAISIDRRDQRVILADGSSEAYDYLLLTPGARPRKLMIAGGNTPIVNYVRDIADTLALQPKLVPGARVVVIGAGFIGLEVAAIARRKGCAVTVLELAATPLQRVAAHGIGEFFARLHRAEGVDLRTGVSVTEIAEHRGRAVVFVNGETLEAEAVVGGIGAIPNTDLPQTAGLFVDDGVVVDERGRTDDPRIFAAGDVTRHYNPLLGRHLRLESWQNAQNQAIAVAKAMIGAGGDYAELPWFWTDQYDVNFQSLGVPLVWDELVWRGDPASKQFLVFYLDEGRSVGANAVNSAREMRFVREILKRGDLVDKARLGDTSVKLADYVKG